VARLPFQKLLDSPFQVLVKEVTFKNLPKLLPLVHLLNLEADKLYEVAITQNVAKIASNDAYLSFSDFKPFILKIKSYEVAIRAAVFVGGAFPLGDDRVASYRLAKIISERWVQSLKSEDAAEGHAAQKILRRTSDILNEAEINALLIQYRLVTLSSMGYAKKPK
jgi:hypothetical protein